MKLIIEDINIDFINDINIKIDSLYKIIVNMQNNINDLVKENKEIIMLLNNKQNLEKKSNKDNSDTVSDNNSDNNFNNNISGNNSDNNYNFNDNYYDNYFNNDSNDNKSENEKISNKNNEFTINDINSNESEDDNDKEFNNLNDSFQKELEKKKEKLLVNSCNKYDEIIKNRSYIIDK